MDILKMSNFEKVGFSFCKKFTLLGHRAKYEKNNSRGVSIIFLYFYRNDLETFFLLTNIYTMSTVLFPKIAKKFYCESCNYTTSNKYDYNKHITTPKHISNVQTATFSINVNPKNAFKVAKYECSVCNYYSKNKSNYDKHLLTDKHINKITGEPKNAKHICSRCNKEYSIYNSLWKHKKHCVVITEREPEPLQNTFTPINKDNSYNSITPEMFMEVLNESKELRNVLIEQNKELQNKLLELASKQTNNTINSHNTNNQFNLQFYLNETCKDAMNIVDFVNSLKLTTDDFETTGKLGFVEGISRIFIKELKKN